MNDYRPGTGQEFRVGVLIIGSLFWDSKPHRETWRRRRLDMDAAQRVPAPIRYGRRSTGRDCSYTMVFSRELVPERFGHAKVVPCRRTVNNTAGIVDEAVHLWTAETRDGENPDQRISSGWGCVALAKHPELSDAVWAGWKQRVSCESCDYGGLNSAVGEKPAVDQHSGLLNIPWPTPVDGSDLSCDVLLATATNPTIVGGGYPSAQQIADAWNTPGGKQHVDYFCKNRAHGIATFQDRDIEERLRQLWR